MGKIFKAIKALPIWIFVQIFRSFFYDNKYFKSKFFRHFWYEGWIWASRDICARIFSRRNLGVRWPVSPLTECGKNIEFDIDDLNNFSGSGCYFQTFDAKIQIGKGTYIAKNVGIITSNHNFFNLEEHCEGRDVKIGKHCWIGMNAIILPGVELGERTIVGAGAVVTHSFESGNCIIAGNPAKVVKDLIPKE